MRIYSDFNPDKKKLIKIIQLQISEKYKPDIGHIVIEDIMSYKSIGYYVLNKGTKWCNLL